MVLPVGVGVRYFCSQVVVVFGIVLFTRACAKKRVFMGLYVYLES